MIWQITLLVTVALAFVIGIGTIIFLGGLLGFLTRKFSEWKRIEITIYLAGPMSQCTEYDKKFWREKVKQYFRDKGYIAETKFVDPVEFVENNMKDAVEGDKKRLEKCDVVIANMWKMSVGTIMEIKHAHDCKIPVYLVAPKSMKNNWWLKYHVKLMNSGLQRVCDYVIQDFLRR
jgi:nucleoside 2-deoxyribosyltransferase